MRKFLKALLGWHDTLEASAPMVSSVETLEQTLNRLGCRKAVDAMQLVVAHYPSRGVVIILETQGVGVIYDLPRQQVGDLCMSLLRAPWGKTRA